MEAAGVRLRGRGRVRQGVCPFHDEAEGSFTVYGDSERFYCFGCGEGGDVLDFIRHMDNLTLPEAIARLDGSPGLAPRAANRPARTRRPKSAALPPRDPALLTAAARFYAGRLRRSSEARAYLASRGVGPVAAARLGIGYSPGGGLRQVLESCGFSEKRIRDSGLFTERGSERFTGMVVVPDPVSSTGQAASGLVRWLVGRALAPDARPRFQALPGPKPVLGLGRLGPAPPWAVVAEGVFDWLALTGWGLPACAALGTQGVERIASALRGCPRVFLAFDNDDAGREATERLVTLFGTQGRRCRPSHGRRRRGRACGLPPWAERVPSPALTGGTLRPLAAPRRFPHSHSHHPEPAPDSDRGRTYAQFAPGFARTRRPVGAAASLIRYRNNTQRRRNEMFNRNGSNNGTHKNGTGNGVVHHDGNGHKPDAAAVSEHELLWDGLSPAVTGALSQPLDPALVSQRKGRAGRTFDYLEGHVVFAQANRIFGFGGWGYELVGDVTLRQIEAVDSQTGEIKTASAYSAPVRVTVAGALPRTDTGFHPVAEDTLDGHDTAIKAAVTDGMKRAFRSFGLQFGNGFYGDPSTGSGDARQPVSAAPRPQSVPVQARGNSGQAQPDNRVQTLRKRLMELAAEQGFDEAKVRTAVQRQTGKDLDGLTADELGELVEAAANKLRERQAQAA